MVNKHTHTVFWQQSTSCLSVFDQFVGLANTFFREYSFIMKKHNQKPTGMFNKQDVTVYFICYNLKRY